MRTLRFAVCKSSTTPDGPLSALVTTDTGLRCRRFADGDCDARWVTENASPTVKITEPGRTPLHLVVRRPVEVGRDCDGLLLADAEALAPSSAAERDRRPGHRAGSRGARTAHSSTGPCWWGRPESKSGR